MPDNALEPFGARLRRLREEAGLSRSQLSRKTAAVDGRGLPEITIKTLETKVQNQATIGTIEILAQSLEVDPTVFVEYRLALARRRLDEREVGLEEALAMLEAVDEALMHPRGAELLERLEAERSAASAQKRPASRRERRTTPAN